MSPRRLILAVTLLPLLLAGCEAGRLPETARTPEAGEMRPVARPQDVPPPPQTARTAEQFDTTSTEDRAAALQAADTGEILLGTTIGSLGNPADPGFWLETPLVSTRQMGRVEYVSSGQSVAVELIPIDGPASAGSRISLPALRLLGVPLTGLPELNVYSG